MITSLDMTSLSWQHLRHRVASESREAIKIKELISLSVFSESDINVFEADTTFVWFLTLTISTDPWMGRGSANTHSRRNISYLILILIHAVNSDISKQFIIRGAGLSFTSAGERTMIMLRPKDSKWLALFGHNTTKPILSLVGDHEAMHSLLYRENEIEDVFVGSYVATRAGSYRLSIIPYTCKSRNTIWVRMHLLIPNTSLWISAASVRHLRLIFEIVIIISPYFSFQVMAGSRVLELIWM